MFKTYCAICKKVITRKEKKESLKGPIPKIMLRKRERVHRLCGEKVIHEVISR